MSSSRSFAAPARHSLKAMIFGTTCSVLIFLGIAHASNREAVPKVVTLERVVASGSRAEAPQQLPTVVITGRRDGATPVTQ